MRIGVIGSGVVGQTLADGFLGQGHEVRRGTRVPAKLEEWRRASGPRASVGTFGETASFGELVVLAPKGSAAEDVVRQCGPANLAGKTVIDTTNPIADAPPDQGVLRFFTRMDESLMERLQRLAPQARFVKAFSCVGSAFMVHPDFDGDKPTMFICGDDPAAKRQVEELLAAFGWETEDVGGVASARAIEPLCVLWCLPGFLRNDWAHAFKMLRK